MKHAQIIMPDLSPLSLRLLVSHSALLVACIRRICASCLHVFPRRAAPFPPLILARTIQRDLTESGEILRLDFDTSVSLISSAARLLFELLGV